MPYHSRRVYYGCSGCRWENIWFAEIEPPITPAYGWRRFVFLFVLPNIAVIPSSDIISFLKSETLGARVEQRHGRRPYVVVSAWRVVPCRCSRSDETNGRRMEKKTINRKNDDEGWVGEGWKRVLADYVALYTFMRRPAWNAVANTPDYLCLPKHK